MHTSITIKNLTKKFGSVVAVRNVSLSIDPGTFLTLLGPSGCGKTTLLRCVAGLEDPDGGEIFIGDKLVFSYDRGISLPAAQRDVGLVFQNYALWPHMKVDKNITFALEVQKMPKAEMEQRVIESLQEVQMEGFEDRYPREMSGGQQQRIALARMLAYRPKVFLMDEPLSNLDARLRMDMRTELKRLHHLSGATTLYVTHDQVEALTMSSNIAVMKDGKVQQFDAPDTVYHFPANLFVADFIGNPKVNLLEGRQGAGLGGSRRVQDRSRDVRRHRRCGARHPARGHRRHHPARPRRGRVRRLLDPAVRSRLDHRGAQARDRADHPRDGHQQDQDGSAGLAQLSAGNPEPVRQGERKPDLALKPIHAERPGPPPKAWATERRVKKGG
jgi:multiple sugar transport system ATP-binding protein